MIKADERRLWTGNSPSFWSVRFDHDPWFQYNWHTMLNRAIIRKEIDAGGSILLLKRCWAARRFVVPGRK